MHKQLSLVGIFVLTLLAMLMAPQVQAATLPFLSPLNPGANVYRYKGETASAYFSTTTDGCIYTDSYVFAGEITAKTGAGSPAVGQSLNVMISRYDVCNAVWLSSAYGYAPVDSNSFQIDQQLTAARLRTNITMTDWNSGAPFTLAVDLQWANNGELSRNKSQSDYESNGCKIKSRFNGVWRSAVASGSLSDGTTNYAANAASYANLQSVKSGEVQVGCG